MLIFRLISNEYWNLQSARSCFVSSLNHFKDGFVSAVKFFSLPLQVILCTSKNDRIQALYQHSSNTGSCRGRSATSSFGWYGCSYKRATSINLLSGGTVWSHSWLTNWDPSGMASPGDDLSDSLHHDRLERNAQIRGEARRVKTEASRNPPLSEPMPSYRSAGDVGRQTLIS
jgi:hypothetical protein